MPEVLHAVGETGRRARWRRARRSCVVLLAVVFVAFADGCGAARVTNGRAARATSGGATHVTNRGSARGPNPPPGSIVAIDSEGLAWGTGWVAEAGEGLIVTAFHVINGAANIDVSVPGGMRWTRATVVGAAPCQDIAVLQVIPPDQPGAVAFQNLPVGSGAAVKVHEPVRAIGYVGGAGRFVTRRGRVINTTAAIRRAAVNGIDAVYTDVVTTDTHLVHGQSGGPLLDRAGELIGMNVELLPNAGHPIGVSIGLQMLVSSVRDLMRGSSLAWVPGTGLEFDSTSKLRRAGLPPGVTIYDTNRTGFFGGKRVLVTRVNGKRVGNTMLSWCKATLLLTRWARLTVIGRPGEPPRQVRVPIG